MKTLNEFLNEELGWSKPINNPFGIDKLKKLFPKLGKTAEQAYTDIDSEEGNDVRSKRYSKDVVGTDGNTYRLSYQNFTSKQTKDLNVSSFVLFIKGKSGKFDDYISTGYVDTSAIEKIK